MNSSDTSLDRLLHATDEYMSRLLRKSAISEDASVDPVSTGSNELVVSAQPTLIENCSMRPYQVEGLDWLVQMARNDMNGILADEMGLGKTLQSIAVLAYMKEHGLMPHLPHLIVCPKSTITNWFNEFRKFCPSLKPVCLIGTAEERESLINEYLRKTERGVFPKFDVLITSFDICRIEVSVLRKIKFGYFILDEAHRIKNEESILSSVVRSINCERILLLTGTPLQNNLHELWAILNFIMPNIFSNVSEFDSVFDDLLKEASTGSGAPNRVTSTLHRILRPFMLRRLKADVARELPEKKELYVYVDLSPLQKQMYRDIILKNADMLLNVARIAQGSVESSSTNVGKVRLVNTLMQLRKVCNHPYLFPGVEPGPPYVEGPHLIENSGKIVVIDKLVRRILSSDHTNQILIFSQMTKVLDILDDYLRFVKVDHCRIDGSTQSSDRQTLIDEFMRPGTNKRVFLLSTRAGGLGINLTSANFVFIFDADFNPQADLQAIDRAHRIGQTRAVTVYRFVSTNTVEEKIIEKAAKKLLIDKMVIQKTKQLSGQNSSSDEISKNELGQMLKFGISDLFNDSDEASKSSLHQDIDELLLFSEKRSSDFIQTSLNKVHQMVLKFENPLAATPAADQSDDTAALPDQVVQAAAMILPSDEASELILDKPRERKSVVPTAPKRTGPPPVIKTKLALWRAQVGGGHDYQFFFSARLDELEKIEKEKGRLSIAQKAEQEKLLKEGFANWTRKNFQLVVRTLEETGYTPEAVNVICDSVSDRSRSEVERYVDVLVKSGGRFLGSVFMSRLSSKLRRLEKANQQVNAKMDALDKKVAQWEQHQSRSESLDDEQTSEIHPPTTIWRTLPVDSAAIEEDDPWTNVADRILLAGVAMYGYGNWVALKSLLRMSPQTAFCFKLHVMTEADIKDRVDDLLDIVEEEFPVKKRK